MLEELPELLPHPATASEQTATNSIRLVTLPVSRVCPVTMPTLRLRPPALIIPYSGAQPVYTIYADTV